MRCLFAGRDISSLSNLNHIQSKVYLLVLGGTRLPPGTETYVEHRLDLLPARRRIPLREGNELLRHPLRLLGLGVRRLDVLVHHQRRDLAAEESDPRRGLAAQVPELSVTARHSRRL